MTRAAPPPPPRYVRSGLVRHSPGAFEQRLGIEDCENGLVLRPDLSRLFAPHGGPVFSYIATLKLHSGRLCGVSGLGAGWSVLRRDLGLVPGDVAVFAKAASADSKFHLARFYDADGNERLDRKLNPFPGGGGRCIGNMPDPRAVSTHHCSIGSAVTPVVAVQGDLTAIAIREAMELAVQCGAREGRDEHYMATKLFVKADNRAMFLTFKTDQGRLNWWKRCYQDMEK